MLSKRTKLIKSTGDAEFTQLYREFYNIEYESLTLCPAPSHISSSSTSASKPQRIELTRDKRIPLYLSMSLPEIYRLLARM